MADRSLDLVRRIEPVVFNSNEKDAFWAAFTEDYERLLRLHRAHPTLTIYTICAWGTENWVFRGVRQVNRLGHLLACNDLGEDFRQMLWEDFVEP